MIILRKLYPGFVDQSLPNHVCLLKKSLNGPKQEPCAWFDSLSQFLLQLGFYCSKVDYSLFIYRVGDIIVNLLIYVDDVLIAGNHNNFIMSLIAKLGHEFAIKDLGHPHYSWGKDHNFSWWHISLPNKVYSGPSIKDTKV